MKKLVTSSTIFGPYWNIYEFDDKYTCDGADLPKSVIGEATIEDWTDIPEPQKPIEEIIAAIKAKQKQTELKDLQAQYKIDQNALQITWLTATVVNGTTEAAKKELIQQQLTDLKTKYVEDSAAIAAKYK